MDKKISIIIPCLNEAGVIVETLKQLQGLRQTGHEIIICDGGSEDNTINLSRPLCDLTISAPAGRASQMNHGALVATGDVLWFLHADTLVPEGAEQDILLGLNSLHVWGRFNIILSGRQVMFRIIEKMINLRSCISGIATGDQGIFVSKEIFNQVGCYEEIPLMEDVSLSRRLKTISQPLCIKTRLITSSRRWEEKGILKTIILMWRLRMEYFLGAAPQDLVNRYQ